MPAASLPKTLIIASHNQGKVREIGALLAPLGIEAISAASLNLPEPEETEATFIGNARLKAVAAAQAANLPALADDSGLEVMALNRAPGIFSARWAGPEKDFNIAMAKVLADMADSPDRAARFVCALALAQPNGEVVEFEGEIWGEIAPSPRGDKGFGYDPIFVARGDTLTFAEIPPPEKHAKSHRAQAFAQLLAHFSAI